MRQKSSVLLQQEPFTIFKSVFSITGTETVNTFKRKRIEGFSCSAPHVLVYPSKIHHNILKRFSAGICFCLSICPSVGRDRTEKNRAPLSALKKNMEVLLGT